MDFKFSKEDRGHIASFMTNLGWCGRYPASYYDRFFNNPFMKFSEWINCHKKGHLFVTYYDRQYGRCLGVWESYYGFIYRLRPTKGVDNYVGAIELPASLWKKDHDSRYIITPSSRSNTIIKLVESLRPATPKEVESLLSIIYRQLDLVRYKQVCVDFRGLHFIPIKSMAPEGLNQGLDYTKYLREAIDDFDTAYARGLQRGFIGLGETNKFIASDYKKVYTTIFSANDFRCCYVCRYYNTLYRKFDMHANCYDDGIDGYRAHLGKDPYDLTDCLKYERNIIK